MKTRLLILALTLAQVLMASAANLHVSEIGPNTYLCEDYVGYHADFLYPGAMRFGLSAGLPNHTYIMLDFKQPFGNDWIMFAGKLNVRLALENMEQPKLVQGEYYRQRSADTGHFSVLLTADKSTESILASHNIIYLTLSQVDPATGREGNEVIISIDPDKYPKTSDVFKQMQRAGSNSGSAASSNQQISLPFKEIIHDVSAVEYNYYAGKTTTETGNVEFEIKTSNGGNYFSITGPPGRNIYVISYAKPSTPAGMIWGRKGAAFINSLPARAAIKIVTDCYVIKSDVGSDGRWGIYEFIYYYDSKAHSHKILVKTFTYEGKELLFLKKMTIAGSYWPRLKAILDVALPLTIGPAQRTANSEQRTAGCENFAKFAGYRDFL